MNISKRKMEVMRALDQPDAMSLQEWARAAGVSYSTLREHRSGLIAAGLVSYAPGVARSTRLTDLGRDALRFRDAGE